MNRIEPALAALMIAMVALVLPNYFIAGLKNRCCEC